MARKWSVTEATETVAFLSDDTGEDVAVLERLPGEVYESESPLNGDDWQSMIDLVAAAPELLAALKRLVEYCDNHSDYDSIGEACAAIAKAEGRIE